MRCERCNNLIEMDGDRIPECEWNGDGWVCPVQEHVQSKYMKLEIRQVDAWKDPDGCWVYNDSIPVREVEYEGELNRSKVLKLLRQLEILSPRKLYKVDDYLFYQGTWIVRMKNDRPVYEVQELDNL